MSSSWATLTPRQAAKTSKPTAVGDRAGVVADAEVALDGALHERFGEAVLHDAVAPRRADRDGMHVGRRAADVDDEDVAETGVAGGALREQARAFHDGGGGRHQHGVEAGGGAVDALGVHDAGDEDIADGGAGGIDVEDAERRA